MNEEFKHIADNFVAPNKANSTIVGDFSPVAIEWFLIITLSMTTMPLYII